MKRQQDSVWKYAFHLIAVVVLVVLAMGIYSQTYDHEFAFDDANSITENPKIWIGDLKPSTIWEAGVTSRPDGRRPLAFATFAINYYFGNVDGNIKNLDPSGFHFVNNIIHAISGVLVYFVALLTFRLLHESRPKEKGTVKRDLSPPMALFAAGLFVAHPIQTQAVTYVVQRMTSMATLFYLLALLCYILGRLRPWGAGRAVLWSGVIVAFALSWGSKQLALPLIVVIPLYEWFFLQKASLAWLKRREVLVVAGLLVFVGAAIVILTMAQRGEQTSFNPLSRLEAGYAERDFTMAERLYTQPRVVMRYLSLVGLPLPQRMSLLHEVETSTSLLSPSTSFLSAIAILALIGAAIYYAPRHRLLSFAVLWFFIHLVIESTVLPLEMMYEHRVYLPFVGIALGLSYLLWTALSRQAMWAAVAACLVVALLSVGTVQRNLAWADIYADTLSKNPDSLRALSGRGIKSLALYSERQPEATKEHLQQAADDFARVIALNPTAIKSRPGEEPKYDRHVKEAYVANAEARSMLGSDDESVLAQYAKVEAIDPKFDMLYMSRGNFFFRRQRYGAAIEEYSKALQHRLANRRELEGEHVEHSAQSADAFFRRGVCYVQQGNYGDAKIEFDRAIKLNENHLQARVLRGVAYLQDKNPQAALAEFNSLLTEYPKLADARFRRAQVYASQGRYREAEADLMQTVRDDGSNVEAGLELLRLWAEAPDPLVRKPAQALQGALRRCQKTGYKDHLWLHVLAMAQAANSQFAEAVATQDKAIALAPVAFHKQYRLRRAQYQAKSLGN